MKARALILILATAWVAAAAEKEKLPGPLLDDLGTLHHPVTTSSKVAQKYFDQGLRLLFGFNHTEAIRSFRSAAKVDPECAMAYWGVAYAYGPHVNRPMMKEDTAEAWTALQSAVAKKHKVSARERAYISALETRYQVEHQDDRSRLDKAFAAAMRDLVKEYPDDLDAQTIFAESLMNTMPWDYWTKDRSPKPETEEVFAALRLVLSRDPNHPGANHFYIHAVEAGPNPELGLPSADRLMNYAPGAGHLVHMPAHIYIRVGQYHDAIVSNQRAVKADRDYIRRCRAQGFYPGVYYPHNIHFLWWAQMFEGRSADSLRAALKAADYANDNYCGPNKVLEAPRLRHLPGLTHLRFGQFDEVMKIPQPAATNDFLVDRVFWHFTRGMVFASRNDAESAAKEHKALAELAGSEAAKKLDNPGFPATAVLAISERWLAARVAGARGDQRAMIQRLEEAVSAEDAMPYMEPSFWAIPVRPALGAALLQAGEAARAEQVFRADLKRLPRNGWGLFGLEQALRAQGKNGAAEIVQRQFAESWRNADTTLDLKFF